MENTMNVKMKRAEAGREGARRRWGANREATRLVRVFAGDADTLGLIDSTVADAVHRLLVASKVAVHRSGLILDTRDAKSLSFLQEPGHRMFVKGVRVAYPAGERVVAISFPVKKIGELLAASHLDYGENLDFHTELNNAADAAKGDTAVAVFPFEGLQT